MKKVLPILSLISAFCCAFALLAEIFPAIVGNDYFVADLITYTSGIIACIPLVLWLITGNKKHKIIALIAIIAEVLLWMPFNKLTPYIALVILVIANIIPVFYSE